MPDEKSEKILAELRAHLDKLGKSYFYGLSIDNGSTFAKTGMPLQRKHRAVTGGKDKTDHDRIALIASIIESASIGLKMPAHELCGIILALDLSVSEKVIKQSIPKNK